MSLQSRLCWSLGLAFVLLWLVAAGVLYLDLSRRLSHTLDERLMASGRMVAGLIARNPQLADGRSGHPLLVWPEDKGTACQIRSQSGEVLLRTGGARGLALSAAGPGFSWLRVGADRWRLYTLRQGNLWITVADRGSERAGLRRGVMLTMILPFALALLGGLTALWIGVRRGLRPLRRLREELAQREPGNLQAVDIGPAPTELNPVVETLNGLLARVDRAMRREQRFANQAAHEFRTPLTAVKTHLQIARRVEGERLAMALQNAERGVARLQRVIEQLLMLARLEGRQVWGEPMARVAAVIEQTLADLPAEDRARVQVSTDRGAVWVPVPEALAAVALRNLVDNALRYTPDDRPVELEVYRRDNGMEMRVRDQGGGDIAPAAHAGHGLGLVIVETIVQRFGGELRRENNPLGGLDSVLHLPDRPGWASACRGETEG